MIGELSNTVELQLLLLGYTLPNQTIIRKNDNGQNKKETDQPRVLQAGDS